MAAPREAPSRGGRGSSARAGSGPFDPADRDVLDRTTRLAASLLDAPVALTTLVSGDRLLFTSAFGPEDPWRTIEGIPLVHSACQHAIFNRAPLLIEDARTDPLVCASPAIGALGVVAYIGVPLLGAEGEPIGSLCAIDDRPRSWTQRDRDVLGDLAANVTAYLGARPTQLRSTAAGLNIAAVARRTGIGADTLRKWERRYGVLRPSRTVGGQRRYDERDVSRVEWLRDRLGEGFRIGEAAALLERGAAGAAGTAAELREAIVRAAEAADVQQLTSLVDQAFTLHDVETAIEEIAAPALRAVGDRWRGGSECIAEEHLLSETVQARLRSLLRDRRHAVRGTAVLACAPGERHELGLLALAVLLQADGWLSVYLGADTPLQAAVATAVRTGASLLCLSAATADGLAALEKAIAELELPPGLTAITGGGAQDELPLGAAVAELRACGRPS